MGVVEIYVWGVIIIGIIQGGGFIRKLHRGQYTVSDDFAGVPFERLVFGSLVWPAVVVIMIYVIYSAITDGKVFKEAEMLLEQKKFERETKQ